jgi:eukaryotic-like serine/threonine-protein kinase
MHPTPPENRKPEHGSTVDSPLAATLAGTSQTAAVTQLPSRTRGRYRIVSEHARGGLGRIWRVFDTDLGRTLALKEALTPTPQTQARFAREALTTARLEHPAIVPVHDAGQAENGEPFYTMKLVAGSTLSEVVRRAPTFEDRLALLPRMLSVIEAMAYAHQQGVLHRDLKPANILVGEFGETAVIDWGLAREVSTEEPAVVAPSDAPLPSGLTQVGAVLGTPAYMPIEQARGAPVDQRADIYALGSCLYFILTGHGPYTVEGDSHATLELVRAAPPPGVRQRCPHVPVDLASIVDTAMAREKEARYPTAQAFADDVRRYLAGHQVLAHRYSWPERLARWVAKHRAVALVTGAMLTILALVLAGATFREASLRGIAEGERARAERNAGSLLEQQGRAALAAGQPRRAAVYLAESLKREPNDPALRMLLSEALRPVAATRIELIGHTQDVVSVAYSPDGRWLLSGGDDGSVRLWRATDGQLERVLGSHTRGIDHVIFSADGRLAASSGLDRIVQLFALDGSSAPRSISVEGGFRIALTPDGSQLIVGSQSGVIHIYDTQSGQLQKTLHHHTSRTHALSFAPNGQQLLVASWDRTVSVWDLKSFEQRQLLTDFDAEVTAIEFSHDGQWVAMAESDSVIHIRRWPSGERSHRIRVPDGARFPQLAFAPDDRVLLGTTADGTLRAWHLSSGQILTAIDLMPEGKLFSAAFAPDTQRLVTGNLSGRATLWSLKDVFDFQLLPAAPVERAATMPGALSADGRFAAIGVDEGRVDWWDLKLNKRLLSFDAGVFPEAVAYSDSAQVLLVANLKGGMRTVQFWKPMQGQILAKFEHPKGVHDVAVSRDGATFATACSDGVVRLFDAAGQLTASHTVDQERLSAVAFAPDGHELAVANGFGTVFFIDKHSGRQLERFTAHPTWVQHLEYSHDGSQLVSAGRQDHQVRLWLRAGLKQQLNITDHTNNVMRASLSPDGRRLLTVALDHKAHLFDALTGRLLRSWSGPGYLAMFVNGKRIVTGGYNGYRVLWNIEEERRSDRELIEVVDRLSPWRLVDGVLTLRDSPP